MEFPRSWLELSKRQHQVTEQLANMYTQSSLYKEMRTELDPLLGEQKARRSSALEEITCVTPFWHQLWWIICRSFKNFQGFSWVTVIQAIIEVIMAVIVGTTFHYLQDDCTEVQRRSVVLYLLTGYECFKSVSARELFMINRDLFLHEHTSGYYRVSSYLFGKLLAELVPRRLLQSIIFTVIIFSITGIRKDVNGFFTMIFTAMMLTYSTSSLSLSLGAGKNAEAVPTHLIINYILFMLFTSGLSLYHINFMYDLSWIQYFSIPHYGFSALQHNEFLGQNFCPEHKTAEISRCQGYVICATEAYLANQGIDISSWGFWKNYVALGCIMIIFLSMTYVQLLHHKKKRCF
ncbi:ATP-binding cassette sub-family G member 3 [Mesocricetus auratus]|uniref:ATP-binding cassette sub-family G member 3 n=1 Tax=Mesocricetus auratus TaxID=10036 RepID=A0ABM2XM54_MESAU|nr:ATP-binding cassette sub-family G member 3 [Mesocricetus auratus]